MKKQAEIFDASLSSEERLSHFIAYSIGVESKLKKTMNQFESLLSFLEIELEDNPAAEKYFLELQNTLNSSFDILYDFKQTSNKSYREFEKIDANLLSKAIVNRASKIFTKEINFNNIDKAVFINGNLLLLQECLLPLLLKFNKGAEKVNVTVKVKELQKDFLKLFHSSSLPGDYFVLTFSTESQGLNSSTHTIDLLFESEEFANVKDSMIYGAIILHSGDIYVSKDTDGNLAISVIIPLSHSAKNYMTSESASHLDEKDLEGIETILLVDDEDMIWDVVIDMLRNMGYTVILAGNGIEALEIYTANPNTIDLVILDMLMPEMDGHSTFFNLKKIDPKVKVLLSSGYVAEDDAQSILDAGAVGFLKKPYRMIDLARKIRTLFA